MRGGEEEERGAPNVERLGHVGRGRGEGGDGPASSSRPDCLSQSTLHKVTRPFPPGGFLHSKQFAKVNGLLNFNKVSKMIS
jgi:hypothetical protein